MSAKRPDSIVQDTVVVSVLIAAEPATVWSFFTDPARLAAWIGAYGGQGPAEGTRMDPRLGGELRVAYPGGNASVGKVTAIQPERLFAFSWGYENAAEGVPPESTKVEIKLAPAAGGTLVELRHSGIPSDGARRGHLAGWKHYLSMLARAAAERQHADTLAGTMDAYYKAWREADEAARLRLLQSCCEADVRVRTGFACTDGIEELSGHIANGLKHMPGMSLVSTGAAQQVHGYARSDWAVQTPDGTAVLRGTNLARLDVSGKIAEVVSFACTG